MLQPSVCHSTNFAKLTVDQNLMDMLQWKTKTNEQQKQHWMQNVTIRFVEVFRVQLLVRVTISGLLELCWCDSTSSHRHLHLYTVSQATFSFHRTLQRLSSSNKQATNMFMGKQSHWNQQMSLLSTDSHTSYAIPKYGTVRIQNMLKRGVA